MSPTEWNSECGAVVSNVSKAYGDEFSSVTVIRDCSFKIADGQLTVLIGPSGCGKTTLINLIAGYERPSSGRITYDGQEVLGPSRDRLVLFQETSLFPWMSVLSNVMYGPLVQGRKATAKREAAEVLAKVGLHEFHQKYPNQLSGGMQRRAELARTLINNPRILLMDEPFRGLDAMTRQLMQEYLLRLFEGSRQTILFVTTEIDEAILLGDTLVLLSSAPGTVRECVRVDLPRPRTAALLTTQRYAQLKSKVLGILYEEALRSFASGSRAAADMVQAFESRHRAEES